MKSATKILISALFSLTLMSAFLGCRKETKLDYSLRQSKSKELQSIDFELIGPYECTGYGYPTEPYDVPQIILGRVIANEPYRIEGSFETTGGKSAPVAVIVKIYHASQKIEEQNFAQVASGNTTFPRPKTLENTSRFSLLVSPHRAGNYFMEVRDPARLDILYATGQFTVSPTAKK